MSRNGAATHFYERRLPQDERQVDPARVGREQAAGDGGRPTGAAVLLEGHGRVRHSPAFDRRQGGEPARGGCLRSASDLLPGTARGKVSAGLGFLNLPELCLVSDLQT